MKPYKIFTCLLKFYLLTITSCSKDPEISGAEPVHEYLIENREGFFSINLDIVTIITIIIIIAFVFGIRYVIFLQKKYSRLSHKVEDIEWELNIIDGKHQKLDKQSTEINKSLQSIWDRLERDENQRIVHLSPVVEAEKTVKEPLKANAKSNTPVFFMPAPDNEGVFDDKKKSRHFIPFESVYQFTSIQNSSNSAEFKIYEDVNNMDRAINYYSTIIETVSNSENVHRSHYRKIITLTPGTAILENNKWIVKQKALVRYE